VSIELALELPQVVVASELGIQCVRIDDVIAVGAPFARPEER
jgi:hypothetical protein